MSLECLRTKEILDTWTDSRCGHGRLACVLHKHAIAIACNSCKDKVTLILDKQANSFVMFSGLSLIRDALRLARP